MANELNLALVIGGFSTIGGMVYGGYELLKNEPRPVTKLMEIKKRAILTEADTELWKQSWASYIEDHTKTVEVEPKETDPPAPADKPKKKETKKEVDTNDAWGLLSGWKDQDERKEKMPEGFRSRCEKIYRSEENGIWTAEYKRFEKYCTKEINPDD